MKRLAIELSLNLLKTILIGAVISAVAIQIQDMHPFTYIGVVMYAFYFLVTALGVYLNLFEVVRESTLYSALSFFFLPLTCLVISTFAFGGLLFGLPFLHVHLYYFLKFRDKTGFSITIHKRVSTLFVFVSLALLILAGIYFHDRYTHESNHEFYQGYVFDLDGNPLAGASVRESLPVYQETITDSVGYFRLYRDKKSYSELICSKEGYETDTVEPFGHHFEMGPVYNFLRTPGHITLIRDTIMNEGEIFLSEDVPM